MTLAPAALALGLLVGAPPAQSLYDTVRAAQRCKPPELDPNRMDCDYDLGSLHFAISAVGEPDTGIAVFKADWDADFHVKYGVQHGCLIISWGAKRVSSDNAFESVFVSPATGAVYRTWAECQGARGKKRG